MDRNRCNHLVRDQDYTVDAEEPPIRTPAASGASQIQRFYRSLSLQARSYSCIPRIASRYSFLESSFHELTRV